MVRSFHGRRPDLATRLPGLKELLGEIQPNNASSYTQWEAYLALYHHKELLVVVPEEGAPRSERYKIDCAQKAAQRAHLTRLQSLGRYPEVRFKTDDHLAGEVLRSSLLELLLGTGKPAADRNRLLHTFKSAGSAVGGTVGVAIDAAASVAVSGSSNKTLEVWDITNRRKRYSLPGHTREITSVAISPDGQFALSGSWDCKVIIWDLCRGRPVHALDAHPGWLLGRTSTVAITHDGRGLSGGADKKLKVWDLSRGCCIAALLGHSKTINSIAVAPNGNVLSGGADGNLILWDLSTCRQVGTRTGAHNDIGGISAVAIAPDGSVALSGSGNGVLKVWDLSALREIDLWTAHAGNKGINSITAAGRSRTALSAGGDGTVRWWSLTDRLEIHPALPAHSGFTGANSVAIAQDGRVAVSAGADNTVKLWDLSW